MTCKQLRAAIPAYLDGELDPSPNIEIERHLASCAECASIAANERAFRAAFHTPALRFAAPPELAGRVGELLRSRTIVAPAPRARSWQWLAVAASLVIAAAAGSLVTRVALAPSPTRLLAGEVLSGHLRAVAGDHPADVVSTDQHTVKPWFAGKVEFSPTVTDLAAEGFPLAGGRLEVVDGRRVAALVYHRRLHVISLYTWPVANGDDNAPVATTESGYNLVRWTRAGMGYWAVSDLDRQELARFAQLLSRGR
ncbi:MAG: anti-sigma factor [Acidobacteriia bacterium]|nr:anti-sigma factor [Terriglobia bacterium]